MKDKLKKFLELVILPYFVCLFILFVYYTSRKKFHFPKNIGDAPMLIVFWHGDLMMQPFTYKNLRPKGKVSAMISDHKDGEFITRAVKYLGIDSVRGSSTRGGAKALIAAIKELRIGNDIAITPDGPNGPRFCVSNGVVALAQKTKAKIIAFSCRPSRYWAFSSWDKFVLPKPFGTLDFFVSEPFSLEGMELEKAKEIVKHNMMKEALNNV